MARQSAYIFDPCVLLSMMATENDYLQIADRLGTQSSNIYRWLAGGIKWDQWRADHYAIRAGYHPANIWGNQWWDTCPDEKQLRNLEAIRRCKERKKAVNA